MDRSVVRSQAVWLAVLGFASVCFSTSVRAQGNGSSGEPWTLSGYIVDAVSTEPLVGATVQEIRSGRGVATDRYGRFALFVEAAQAELRISYLGYAEMRLVVPMVRDTLVRIGLESLAMSLDTVEISAASGAPEGVGRIRLSPEEINRIPALGGESDPVKAFHLLPGVQGGQEGSAGLFVRGGTPDQNLILLDGTPVYNATHLLGFLSTFNPDVVRSAELTKGPGSAQHGGRLASVLDVAMKEGDLHEHRVRGAIGLVSSRIMAEGPIRRSRAAYLLAVRRTYIDALWRLFQPSNEQSGYHFYDLVGKVSLVGARQGAVLSLYGGQDRLWTRYDMDREFFRERYNGGLGWGNVTGTLRWYGQITPRLLATASVGVTRYALAFEEETKEGESGKFDFEVNRAAYRNGVVDWTAGVDLDYLLTTSHRFRFGAHAVRHAFRPSSSRVTTQEGAQHAVTREFGNTIPVRGTSLALYAEDGFELGRAWTGTAGVRASAFASEGATYTGLEPRLALRWTPSVRTTFSIAYAQARQYIHLVSRSGVGIPLDLWLPTTSGIGPQRAWQVDLGATRELSPSVTFSAGMFVKQMEGLVAPLEGSSLLGTDAVEWEERVIRGRGDAYGFEVLLRKRIGRISGCAAYTLSKSQRKFPDIDDGASFPARFDRRHDVALTVSYQYNTGWQISSTWVYNTGDAIWLPMARALGVEDSAGYPADPGYNPAPDAYVYGPRNGGRAPVYHRLDVAVQHEKKTRRGSRTWTFGLYNAYGRQNPFFLYPRTSPDGRYELRKSSPLVFIPAVSYAFTL